MSEEKWVKINNTWFDQAITSEMKKEDFINAHKGIESVDAEDCWNQLKALSITPSKKK
jgi:hypothetical protein